MHTAEGRYDISSDRLKKKKGKKEITQGDYAATAQRAVEHLKQASGEVKWQLAVKATRSLG